MARRSRNQSPEEQQFNDILSNASKSFKKEAEELYKTIEMQNKYLIQALKKRETASKQDRERIDEDIERHQKSLEEAFESLNSGVASFWEEWTDEEKKAYIDKIDKIEEEKKALDKTISKVRGQLVRTIEDAEDAIKSQQKTLAETVNEFSEKMRNWADTLNLSAIRSSLEDSVDSFVKNRRELDSALGDWFDPKKFSEITSQTVKDLGSYSRSEASELITDLTKEFRFNSNEQMAQFSKEIAASTKAFDASISDYSHSLWRDVNGDFEGELVRGINNLAGIMSQSNQLNVKPIDILTKIDENIDSIFGAHSKNAKTQKNLLKSVASIEAIESTAANTGISTLSESILEWSKKSNIELLEDDSFMAFSRMTGISWQDFQNTIKSGDVSQLYTRLYDRLNTYQGDDSTVQAQLTYLAQELGWSYSELRDIRDLDRKGLQDTIDAANGAATEAEQATEQGYSTAEAQENELVGAVEAFKNDMSDVFKPVIDFFSGFDISLGEIASVITIGSTAAKAISGFLGVGGGIGGLKGLLSGVLGIGGGSGGGLLSGLVGGGGAAATGGGGLLSGLVGGGGSAIGASGALGGASGALGGAGAAGGGIMSSMASGIGTLVSTGGPIAGGVWAVADSVNGLSKSVEWLGEEDGNSMSGKFASAVGGALGGDDSGLSGGLKGAAKGALIGAFAGPVGMAIGGAIGAVTGAIGGEKIAKMAKTAFDFIGEVGGKFFSAVGGFAKAVGSGVKKVFSGIADFGHDVFTNAVEGFDTLLRGTGKFAESLGKGVGSAFKGAGQFAKGIGKGVGKILSGFGAGAGKFAEGIGKGFSSIIESAGSFAESLGKGFGSIISSTGDLAEGIGKGLGSIVSSVGDFAEGIGIGFGSIITSTGDFAESIGKGIGTILKGIGGLAESIGKGIGDILTGAGKGLGAFAEGIGTGIGGILDGAGDMAEGMGKGFGSIVSSTGDLAEGIGRGFSSIITSTGDLAEGIGRGWSSIISSTGEFAESVGKGFSSIIESAGSFAESIGVGFSSIITSASDLAEGIGTGLGSIISSTGELAEGIGKGFSSIVTSAGDFAESIGSGVGSVLTATGDLAEGIGKGIGGVFSGAGQGAGAFARGVGEGVGNVFSGIGNFVDTLGKGIGSVFEGMGNFASGIGEGIGNVINATGDLAKDIGEGLGSILSSTGDLASGIGEGIGSTLVGAGQGLGAFAEGIGSGIGGVLSGGGDFVQKVTDGVTGAVTGVIGSVFGGAGDVIESLGNAGGNLIDSLFGGVNNLLFGDDGKVELDISKIERTGNPIVDNLTYILAYTKFIAETIGSGNYSGASSGYQGSEEGEKHYGGIVGAVQDAWGAFVDGVNDVVDYFFAEQQPMGKYGKKIPIDQPLTEGYLLEEGSERPNTTSGYFAEGSSYISNDGLAYLHKGEAVLTKLQADVIRDKADGGIDTQGIINDLNKNLITSFADWSVMSPLELLEDKPFMTYSRMTGNSWQDLQDRVSSGDYASLVTDLKDAIDVHTQGADENTNQAYLTHFAQELGWSYEQLKDIQDIDRDSLTQAVNNCMATFKGFEDIEPKTVNKFLDDSIDFFKESKDSSNSIIKEFKANGILGKNFKLSGSGLLSKVFKGLFGNSTTGQAFQKMLSGKSTGGSFLSRLKSALGGIGSSSGGSSSGGSSGSSSVSSFSGSDSDSGSSGGGGTTKLAGNSTTDKIFNYLKNKLKLNNAGAAGVLGNLQRESGFNTTAVGDNGTSYGIVQWHNSRWTNLKNFASQNGKDQSDLGVQLDFMKHELESNGWPGVYKDIKNVPNTLEGAKKAAEVWVRRYEMPGDIENEVITRQNYASNWWDQYGSYDTGTPWVPDDQVALIHEGEMIVPADQNPMNISTSSESVPLTTQSSEDSTSEVIDVMKWQIYRLESKLDKLITAVVSSGSSKPKRNYGQEVTDTDLAYARYGTWVKQK